MRPLLALTLSLLTAATASAQCGRYPPRYAAPAKAVAKVEQVTVVLLPAAVYVVPGPPTVVIQQTVIQQTTVQQTVIRR
jgi:hypothetical protein